MKEAATIPAPSARSQPTAVITGASRGLGEAMARALAAEGYRLGLLARTAPWALAQELGAVAAAADVCDRSAVAAALDGLIGELGGLDVLVNNAGVMGGETSLDALADKDWQRIIDTNVNGPWWCTRTALPALRRSRGVIVNITSGAAVKTGFLNLAYGVSKAALDRMTAGLAAELTDTGVACIGLSPPVSATDTVRAIYPDRDVDAFAAPPAETAAALCRLLAADPRPLSGRVFGVREVQSWT